MRIGVPREDTAGETRVALTPNEVRTLADQGHEIVVEHGARGKGRRSRR
jgi:alanine dehydrogenase